MVKREKPAVRTITLILTLDDILVNTDRLAINIAQIPV